MSYAPVQRLYRFQIGELCGLKSTKQVTIVKGTTVPASVTAHKDQSQDKAFEESVPSMTVHFEATTPGALANAGPRLPHPQGVSIYRNGLSPVFDSPFLRTYQSFRGPSSRPSQRFAHHSPPQLGRSIPISAKTMTGTIKMYHPRPRLSVKIKTLRTRKLRTIRSKPTGTSFMLLMLGVFFCESSGR